MPHERSSDIDFALGEVFAVEAHWRRLSLDMDLPTAAALLAAAAKLADERLAPLNAAGDRQGARFDSESGAVATPDGFKEAWRDCAAGGWIGLCGDPAHGGQGGSHVLRLLCEEMMAAANAAFSLYPCLTSGVAHAIERHADQTLRERYLPALYAGRWSGAMCLTEAQAGTDLGLIRSLAEPDGDAYRLSGDKIFITGGEHDLCENIVHLALARTPDAPPGSKGLSLFLAPKRLPDGDANGVACRRIESKMGIHASATCHLRFEAARAWLVGERHKGLAAMFTIMNYERIGVGVQALGIAAEAYRRARDYALERLQGRDAAGAAPAPIIAHADVRRMLLTQRAFVEGGRAFVVYLGMLLDRAAARDEQAERLLALLTPVAKAFLTDAGLECCVAAQQVFGGHGYIRDHGVEQLVRDVRITQIYEGTNGVQAADLLGRKVAADGGEALRLYMEEMRAAARDAAAPPELAETFAGAARRLRDVTEALLAVGEPQALHAAAVDYLQLFGLTALAHMWLKMTSTAAKTPLAETKRRVADFYYQRILPRAAAHAEAALGAPETLSALAAEDF